MADALRNQYLQSLGIVQYVSKDLPVVVAVPMPEGLAAGTDLPVEQTSPRGLSGPGSESAGAQKQSMAALVDIVGQPQEAQPVPVPSPASLGQVGEETSQAQENIELTLGLWGATDELLVCTSIDDALPDPAQILLLGNILEAMGQGNGPLPQIEVIQWPPNPSMAGGEAELRDDLSTLFGARLRAQPAKYLLLLGDDAAHWLLSDSQREAMANGQVDCFDQVTAMLVPSLQAMIDQPQCKRETWQVIRFLSPLRHVHRAES